MCNGVYSGPQHRDVKAKPYFTHARINQCNTIALNMGLTVMDTTKASYFVLNQTTPHIMSMNGVPPHALITPNFPFGSSHEIVGDYVQK